MAQEKALQEIKLSQLADNCTFYESDNKELSEQVRDLKFKLIQAEIDIEMAKLRSMEERQEVQEQDDSYKQLLELQVQNDGLLWEKSILEAEKL